MATIENLGAAYSKRIAKQAEAMDLLPRPKRVKPKEAKKLLPARREVEIRIAEEARASRDSSKAGDRASDKKMAQIQRMTLEELAAMLRKVNLTFDLFEIQAKITVDPETGEYSVVVTNQRTGEVLRKIPPYDVPRFSEAVVNGEPAMTDVIV